MSQPPIPFNGQLLRPLPPGTSPRSTSNIRQFDQHPVPDRLRQLGGIASRNALLEHVSPAALRQAAAAGQVIRTSRARFALPCIGDAARAALAVSGVLCLTSAALHHGWPVKLPPERPQVAVPRNRKRDGRAYRDVQVFYRDLETDDLERFATSKSATLLHCLRILPRDEALVIADSVARAGRWDLLHDAGDHVRGRGAARVRATARLASAEAANPFESVLRSVALDIPQLAVVPQVVLSTDPWIQPDLVDQRLKIALEADSFQWHGSRAALRRDARRYDELVARGWHVLRFAWEDVMFQQSWVHGTIRAATEIAAQRAHVA